MERPCPERTVAEAFCPDHLGGERLEAQRTKASPRFGVVALARIIREVKEDEIVAMAATS